MAATVSEQNPSSDTLGLPYRWGHVTADGRTVQGMLDTGFDGFLRLPICWVVSLGLELIDLTPMELAVWFCLSGLYLLHSIHVRGALCS
ncbi:MAG: hypothetical protein ACREOH_12385, partial [Candidatus Entotheonellia bacterium]